MKKFLTTAAIVGAVSVGAASGAFADGVTLPTTGVDVGAYSTALVTNLGTVIGDAIAAGFAIFALWMGFRYVKTAIKGGK